MDWNGHGRSATGGSHRAPTGTGPTRGRADVGGARGTRPDRGELPPGVPTRGRGAAPHRAGPGRRRRQNASARTGHYSSRPCSSGPTCARTDPVASAAERGAEIVQMFLADPQGWKKPPAHPQAEQLRERPLAVVVHSPVRGQPGLAEQPDPHPVAQAGGAARRGRGRGRRDRAGGARRARHRGRGRPRRGVDNWRKFLARQADEGGFAVPVLIENTAGGDNAMARRFDALARLWDAVGEFGVGLLPRHLPRLRRRRGPGRRRRPGQGHHRAGSTWCTSTTRATSSARPATGTPTSATAPSTPDALVAVCAAAGAPVVVETPAEGQAADIAFLRERLGSVTPVTPARPPARPGRRQATPGRPSGRRRPGRGRAAARGHRRAHRAHAGARVRQQGPLRGPGVRRGRAAAPPTTTVRIDRDVCYSDIQYLWLGRDIDQHVFPYVHGVDHARRASCAAARSSTRCSPGC